MPTPTQIGLPRKFRHWRKGQEKAFERVHFSKNRFAILNSPVGSGKSGIAMASAILDSAASDDPESYRTLYLTANRHLQDQVRDDFKSTGLVDIRGRDNYTCDIDPARTAAYAKCTAGLWCNRMKRDGDGPCEFYDQKRAASDSKMTLSNYAFWLHDEESQSLGRYRRIILDEAHRAPEQIEKFASVEIRDQDQIEILGGVFPIPRALEQEDRWKVVMLEAVGQAQEKRRASMVVTGSGSNIAWMRKAKDLERRLKRLCRLSAREWLCSRSGRSWKWDLLNPGLLAEQLLFRGASKIVLASATVNHKTLDLLGVDSRGIKIIEQDSTFPVARRPIYYWPVARVGQNMEYADRRRWARAIDEILEPRQDRKGLIHSVSYQRALEIIAQSKFRDSGLFVVHKKGQRMSDVVAEFKSRRGPAWLVTPAATEGVDLPLDLCEFIIIPKMPFPDMRDRLVQIRKTRDKDYIPYLVLQAVVQAVGRGMRSAEDSCESFILDGHFGWLKAGYYQYLPRWFQVALRTLDRDGDAPAPLRKLAA